MFTQSHSEDRERLVLNMTNPSLGQLQSCRLYYDAKEWLCVQSINFKLRVDAIIIIFLYKYKTEVMLLLWEQSVHHEFVYLFEKTFTEFELASCA